jgi:hypothetical protein
MQSFAWRHWGCVTPKIFENIKKSFSEGSEVDGYDDLTPEDQAKIVKAWQDGHVADEDIPPTARKPADEDGEEKPKKAKRAPAKKKAAAVSDGEAEERPKSKRKAAVKKTVEDEAGEDDEKEEEEEKPKKKRAPPKKKAEPKEKAAPKKRASKKKKEEVDEESGEDFTKELDDVPVGSDEEDEPEEKENSKKAPAKKPASKPASKAKTADEGMADGEDVPGGSKKRKRSAPKADKPASAAKKAKPTSKAKKSEEKEENDEEEE